MSVQVQVILRGIRISVSAARGLALGLQIPAIGVTSFETTLYGRGNENLALLPANKGFYYIGSNPKMQNL